MSKKIPLEKIEFMHNLYRAERSINKISSLSQVSYATALKYCTPENIAKYKKPIRDSHKLSPATINDKIVAQKKVLNLMQTMKKQF